MSDETPVPAPADPLIVFLKQNIPPRRRVLIVPHDYPDPDALASAGAMHLLLQRLGVHSVIAFTGVVSRAENKELLRHFRYGCKALGRLKPSRRQVLCIFVDTAPWSGNVTVPSYARPLAVIDHHPAAGGKKWGGLFRDIQSGIGSTTTMMHEHLAAVGVAIPRWLSTVMAYAIATETMDLSRDFTERDRRAYSAALSNCSFKMLGLIRHAALPRAYYARLQEAMANAWIYGRTAWSHLDHAEHPEIVAEVADLLLRMERVTWSFCTADMDERLTISLRSSQATAHCGRILKRVVGKEGSAGGHDHMAAGYLELGKASPAERKARRDDLVKGLLARIERRSGPGLEFVGLSAQRLIETPPA